MRRITSYKLKLANTIWVEVIAKKGEIISIDDVKAHVSRAGYNFDELEERQYYRVYTCDYLFEYYDGDTKVCEVIREAEKFEVEYDN